MARVAELPALETSSPAKAGTKRSKISKRFWQQLGGAYAVAAGLTIVLMLTGHVNHLAVYLKGGKLIYPLLRIDR